MIYQPSEDSFLLESYVKKKAKNKSFLDMGSASGIQSVAAKKSGAKSVLAVDINPEAVKFLKNKKIPCVQSDLFENVKGKFDIIAFNPPYLPSDAREDSESQQITSGGKHGDEIILRFLNQAPGHLNEKGEILLVLSSLTPKKRILSLISSLKMKKSIAEEKKLFMETLYVWEITRNHNNP